MPELRICSRCEIKKEIKCFYKDKGHKGGRHTICKECVKKKTKLFYQNNKTDIAVYKKEYYLKNKVEIARRQREYSGTERGKLVLRKAQVKFYKTEKGKACSKRRQKKYHQTIGGKATLMRANHKRRALTANANYENFNPIEVLERDGYRCQHCGKKTRPDYKNIYHDLYPNLDHIIPLSKGGDHPKLNTQCLCRRCNMVKHSDCSGEQLLLFG